MSSAENEKHIARSVADSCPFSAFSRLLSKIQNSTGKEKRIIFDKFVAEWRKLDVHADCYPFMRLMLPTFDREYGMKATTLAKMYVQVLSISPQSPDALALLNWRAPTVSHGTSFPSTSRLPHFDRHHHDMIASAAGDFAKVAQSILQRRSHVRDEHLPLLTVADVNALLSKLSAHREKNSGEAPQSPSADFKHLQTREQIIRHMILSTSIEEQYWLIRIILKEMKLGLSEKSILNAYHPDAIDLFAVCSNLKKVCDDLRESVDSPGKSDLQLFHPFKPMLSKRVPFHDIFNLMHKDRFYIETKYDGERIQMHSDGKKFMYFSRKSTDYTHLYGEDVNGAGSLTPFLHDVFSQNVQSIILDGEMLAWSPDTRRFQAFGNLKTAAKDSEMPNGTKHRPCFVVFDIVYLNGSTLVNLPLAERLDCLHKVLREKEGYLHISQPKIGNSLTDVANALEEHLLAQEEGIIIKRPSSVYLPNQRDKHSWIKVKPEYLESISSDIDVVIVGGFYGTGYRGGRISHFMCGVRQNEQSFRSFCKFGSGYTMSELTELGNKLNPYWKRYDAANPPEWLLMPPKCKEKPDVFIEPENSVVVTLKAAEIVESLQYATGYTLRFPRLTSIRFDKPITDGIDMIELNELISSRGRRMQDSAGRIGAIDMIDQSAKQLSLSRATAKSVVNKRRVLSSFLGADVSQITVKDHMFDSLEFCVLSGCNPHVLFQGQQMDSKHSIEILIASFGGSITQNPTSKTFCIVAGVTENMRVRNAMKDRRFDVVKPSWIFDCIETGAVLPFASHHLHSFSPATEASLLRVYDTYGDSYTVDIQSVEEMRTILQRGTIFGKRKPAPSATVGKAVVLPELICRNLLKPLFCNLRTWIVFFQPINLPAVNTERRSARFLEETSQFETLEPLLKFYGASISKQLNCHVTHVIVGCYSSPNVSSFLEANFTRAVIDTVTLLSMLRAENKDPK